MTKEYQTRRVCDAENEKKLIPYFNQVYQQSGCTMFCRNENVELQKRGIDVFMYSKHRKILNLDEKCATRYWQGNLKTFALELWTTNNGKNNGWFNPNNDYVLTTDYNFAWVTASDEHLSKIYSLECAMIRKSDIWEYLKSIGFTYESLMQAFNDNAEVVKKYDRASLRYIISPDLYIVQSLHLTEAPINLVVSKSLLKDLSYFHTLAKFDC